MRNLILVAFACMSLMACSRLHLGHHASHHMGHTASSMSPARGH